MSDSEPIIPEGMHKYFVLGLGLVAPVGTPEELLVAIAEAMVQSGHVIFDPVTNTLKPNPNNVDGKLQGIDMQIDDLGRVHNAKAVPDDEIKKKFGISDLNIGDNPIPKPKSDQ
jgi:hypothetical protein